jgi:hypothetical protein
MAEEDLNFSQALSMASREITALLKRQVPVDTGELKRSISVKGNFTGESIQFRYGYLKYGVYVDKGTGPYAVRGKGKSGDWNPRPGKGRGGIRPRFWTSLNPATRNRIKRVIARVTAQFIRTQFRKVTI